jgi:hypothetical protein
MASALGTVCPNPGASTCCDVNENAPGCLDIANKQQPAFSHIRTASPVGASTRAKPSVGVTSDRL